MSIHIEYIDGSAGWLQCSTFVIRDNMLVMTFSADQVPLVGAESGKTYTEYIPLSAIKSLIVPNDNIHSRTYLT